MAPTVESYEFGRIVIDGTAYENDVIIFPDRVYAEWWRDKGHRLQPQDLEMVVEEGPDIVIVGTGFNERMKVPERTKDFLDERGIDFKIQGTRKAWTTFNETSGDAVAAFHLTC
jgi:hypothetical protein